MLSFCFSYMLRMTRQMGRVDVGPIMFIGNHLILLSPQLYFGIKKKFFGGIEGYYCKGLTEM